MSRVPGTYCSRRPMRALYLVPSPTTPGLTAAEQVALRLRRDATVAGVCACGARFPRVRCRRGVVAKVAMIHEVDCPAADGPHFDQLVRRLGDRLEWETVVVEFEVAA